MALLTKREELLKLLEDSGDHESAIYDLLGLNASPSNIVTDPNLNDEQAYADGMTGPSALFTSFKDYFAIYKDILARGLTSFCDLGGGIGKGKLLFDLLSQNESFKSYSLEFLKSRHEEGKSIHQNYLLPFNDGFKCCNLLDTSIPQVEAYFIYLPVGPVMEALISQLEKVFHESKGYLYVIESHGDLISYLEKSLPIKLVSKIPLISQRHNPDLHIYFIGPLKEWNIAREALLKQNNESLKSFSGIDFCNYSSCDILNTLKQFRQQRDLQLIIKEDSSAWLGDLYEWKFGIQEETIEIQSPYRIVNLEQIQGIVRPTPQWQKLVTKRSAGLKPPLSLLRKIFIAPKSAVEYSNGEIEEVDLEWPRYNFPQHRGRLLL